MCRVLSYIGPSVLLDDLLYRPDSSLVRQSYDPQQLHMLNLGGFGMLAWDSESADPARPWAYRSTSLPVFDPNLEALAKKARTSCLLAHVRGIPYRSDAGLGAHNLHPFHFAGQSWAMAHNGDLAGHRRIRHDLLAHVPASLREQIAGNTDSETIYALVMGLLETPDADATALVAAVAKAVALLRELRRAHGIEQSSSLNLFFSNGASIVALRYTLDFGCYDTSDPASVHEANLRYLSLWYTVGERYGLVQDEWQMGGDPSSTRSVLLASEPLTRDITGWIEVPEYTVLVVERGEGTTRIHTVDLD